MPLHIEELTSEVTVIDGDSLLSAAQKESIVQMVIKRIGEKLRESELKKNATEVRHQAGAPLEV